MQQVSARAVPALIDQLLEQNLQPVVLDVREPWEVALAKPRVDGARWLAVPMREIPANLARLDSTQPILALCHHGLRSRQVVAFLLQQGYPHAYNIEGGIDAWSRDVDPGVARY